MEIKAYLKCTFNATPALVCDLVKAREEDFTSFLQFFHFVYNSCQSHNGLISSRPSWRQWAGFGLVQDLWFGLRLCGLWSTEKNHLFWRAFLLYVSHMHVLSAFLERRVILNWGLLCLSVSFLLCLLYLLPQTTMEREEQRIYSVLTTRLIWSLLLFPSFPICTEAFLFAHNQILSLASTAALYSLMTEL